MSSGLPRELQALRALRRWKLTTYHDGTPIIRTEDGRIVCSLPRVNTSAEIYERTANGDLIVMAPNLEEAARDVLEHPEDKAAKVRLKWVLGRIGG